MGLVVLFVIVIAVIALASTGRKKRPSASAAREISFRISTETIHAPPARPMASAGSAEMWTLNPGSVHPVTLVCNRAVAAEAKALLDGWDTNPNRDTIKRLTALIAAKNIVCEEIRLYREATRPRFVAKIRELTRAHPEWSGSSDLDREDIAAEIRENALASVPAFPGCDGIYLDPERISKALLEPESLEMTVDDELLRRYGFEVSASYLDLATTVGRVRQVEHGDYQRSDFERLARAALALRGSQIPKEKLLESLTLKEMKTWLKEPRPFRRKADAIAYLLAQPWIDATIREKVGLRELFLVLPPPAELGVPDVTEIARAWSHANAVARVIVTNYLRSPHESHA